MGSMGWTPPFETAQHNFVAIYTISLELTKQIPYIVLEPSLLWALPVVIQSVCQLKVIHSEL